VSILGLILIILAGCVSYILGGVLAIYIEKFAESHPKFIRWTTIKKFYVFLFLFIVFSIPGGYVSWKRDFLKTPSIKNHNNDISIIDHMEAKIPFGKTNSFYGDDLYVTVNKIDAHAQSTQVTIGSPGYPNKRGDDLKTGDSVIYIGKFSYDIRIIKIDKCGRGKCIDIIVSRL